MKVTVEFDDEDWERVQEHAIDTLWANTGDDDYPLATLEGVTAANILRLAVGEPPQKHGGKREKLTYRAVS